MSGEALFLASLLLEDGRIFGFYVQEEAVARSRVLFEKKRSLGEVYALLQRARKYVGINSAKIPRKSRVRIFQFGLASEIGQSLRDKARDDDSGSNSGGRGYR